MNPPLLITCDFDGTVTRQDTLVEILNRYGDPRWTTIQTQVLSGKLSIREGLEAQMNSVRANPGQIRRFLKERIELDPTFPRFFGKMRAQGIPLILLTGGFDLCVETVMAKSGLWPVPYLANRLHFAPLSPSGGEGRGEGGSWQVQFPYPSSFCSACGHCKADSIRSWNRQGYTTVFVGNGVTDRCPAQAASVTFAKDELYRWCRTQGIAHVPFKNFDDIHEELVRRQWL